MSNRDYSSITTSGGGSATPGGGRRPLWIGLASLVVLVVVVAIIAVSCSGGSSSNDAKGPASSGTAIRAAHGPSSINNNIPAGYTRDKVGAASAAVNFTQAVDQARAGRISGEDLRTQSAGPQATDALLNVLNISSDRDEQKGQVFNAAPVVTTVPDYTNDRAVVAVWSVGAGQTPVGNAGRISLQTTWGTTTVTMVWADDDWKAVDWKYQVGPNPDDVTFPEGDSPLAKQATAGFYTYFID